MVLYDKQATSTSSGSQYRGDERIANVGPGLEQNTTSHLDSAARAAYAASAHADERADGVPIIDDMSGVNAERERDCVTGCEETLLNLHESWRDISQYQDLMADKLTDEQLADLQETARDISDAERDCAQVLKTIDPDNPYFDASHSSMRDFEPDSVTPLSTPPDWDQVSHKLDSISSDIDRTENGFERDFAGLAREICGDSKPAKSKSSHSVEDGGKTASPLEGGTDESAANQLKEEAPVHDGADAARTDLDAAVDATIDGIGKIATESTRILEAEAPKAGTSQPEF